MRLHLCTIMCKEFAQLVYNMWLQLSTSTEGLFSLEETAAAVKLSKSQKKRMKGKSKGSGATGEGDKNARRLINEHFSFVCSTTTRVYSEQAKKNILDLVRLGASGEGYDWDIVALDATTTTDIWKLMEVMNHASDGNFLTNGELSVTNLFAIPKSTSWFSELVSGNIVNLAALIANRIEVTIWETYERSKHAQVPTSLGSPFKEWEQMAAQWAAQPPLERWRYFGEVQGVVDGILDTVSEHQNDRENKFKESFASRQVRKALHEGSSDQTGAVNGSRRNSDDSMLKGWPKETKKSEQSFRSMVKERCSKEIEAYKALRSQGSLYEPKNIDAKALDALADSFQAVAAEFHEMRSELAKPGWTTTKQMEQEVMEQHRLKCKYFLIFATTLWMQRLSGLDGCGKARDFPAAMESVVQDIYFTPSRLPSSGMPTGKIDNRPKLPFNGTLFSMSIWTGYTGYMRRALRCQIQCACAKMAEADLLRSEEKSKAKASKSEKSSAKKRNRKAAKAAARQGEEPDEGSGKKEQVPPGLCIRAPVVSKAPVQGVSGRIDLVAMVTRCKLLRGCRRLVSQYRKVCSLAKHRATRRYLHLLHSSMARHKAAAVPGSAGSKKKLLSTSIKLKVYHAMIVLARQGCSVAIRVWCAVLAARKQVRQKIHPKFEGFYQVLEEWHTAAGVAVLFKRWQRNQHLPAEQAWPALDDMGLETIPAGVNDKLKEISALNMLHMRLHQHISEIGQVSTEEFKAVLEGIDVEIEG